MAEPEKPATDDQIQIFTSDQSMHEVMRQQVADMLAQSDLSEEQKQQILVAMQCPCCGSGGVSMSIKLKD
jgi:hypothetical protein